MALLGPGWRSQSRHVIGRYSRLLCGKSEVLHITTEPPAVVKAQVMHRIKPVGRYMERNPTGRRRIAISGGLAADLATRLRWACGQDRSHELLREAATLDELFEALVTADRGRPATVVLAAPWLKNEGLQLLTEVQRLRAELARVNAEIDNLVEVLAKRG